MLLNDKVCWTRTNRDQGKPNRCGQGRADERWPVTGCTVKLCCQGEIPLKVTVKTNLNQPGEDESFGIDNVVVEKTEGLGTSVCVVSMCVRKFVRKFVRACVRV